MKTTLILFVTLFICADSYSQTAFSFLKLDASARSAALEGSFVSNADDPNVIFYNPASIGFLKNDQLSIGFLKHLLDVNSGFLSYAPFIKGIGRVGFAVAYTNYGSFDLKDEYGNKLGTFGANEFALFTNYNNSLFTNFYYGINLKLITSILHDRTSIAGAIDFGFSYFNPVDNLGVGISILNYGTQFKSYFDKKENLPLEIKAGVSKKLEHLPLTLSFNLHHLNETTSNLFEKLGNFSLGGEFYISKVINLRFGYNNEKRKELKIGTTAGLAGFSAGFGVLVDFYRFDYSFSSQGAIGALHRLNLTLNM